MAVWKIYAWISNQRQTTLIANPVQLYFLYLYGQENSKSKSPFLSLLCLEVVGDEGQQMSESSRSSSWKYLHSFFCLGFSKENLSYGSGLERKMMDMAEDGTYCSQRSTSLIQMKKWPFPHHYQGRIDFNTVNPRHSAGMDFVSIPARMVVLANPVPRDRIFQYSP